MREEGAVLITSNPALMVTRMPLATRPLYLPHDDIKSMGDYEEKITAIAERYLDWDVRAAAGTTCWFTILFDKVLEVARRQRKHVRHVADVWPNLRVLLGGGVSADPYLPVLASSSAATMSCSSTRTMRRKAASTQRAIFRANPGCSFCLTAVHFSSSSLWKSANDPTRRAPLWRSNRIARTRSS